jgi:SET domain-containing protein
MELVRPSKLVVASSPIHGLGVFATQSISPGEIIEECHFITFDATADDPIFNDYRFIVGRSEKLGCVKYGVLLGFGGIYNHSENPNINWRHDTEKNCFTFFALVDINQGDELCSYYGGPDYWKSISIEI